MATISSAGIGSGLDVSSIVDKLVAIERSPITSLQTKATAIQTKLSSFGLLSSYMTNLGDISAQLAKADFWTQTSATSADAATVGVSATSGAAAGTYSIAVTQLAQAQSLASKPYTSPTATVGTGTLKIEIGNWDDAGTASIADADGGTASVADASKTAFDITIGAGEDTLDAIKKKINAAGAGVTASIVTDAKGARLVLRSNATGSTGAMRITATDEDGNAAGAGGLAALAYDPAGTGSGMTQTQRPLDALATVNGLAVTSPNNTLAGVVEGVTFTLAKVSTAAVDVSVSLDTAAQRTAVTAFAQAFSDINTYIAGQTKYDPATKKAAVLQGDRATLTLQSQLRNLMQGAGGAGGSFSRLSDIGIEAQVNGTFTVNDTKLSAALAKPAELARLFSAAATAGSTGTASQEGYAVRAKALATQLSNSDGLLTSTAKGLRDSITRNSAAQQTLEARVALTKTRLTKQYSSLDTTISQISSTNSQLTQSLASLTSLMTSIANSN